MRALKLSRAPGYDFSYFGASAAMICPYGLRKYTDVQRHNTEIEVVALKVQPDEDCFNVRSNGTLEGVRVELDCDFQAWLQRGAARGYNYVYVNEVE